MSYKVPLSENITDLLTRKEFYRLKYDPSNDFKNVPNALPDIPGELLTRTHQIFGSTLMNPSSPNTRLHLSWKTGVGKTLGGITIAQPFIALYKQMHIIAMAKNPNLRRNYSEMDRASPSVVVLGWGGTSTAFIKELLTYPDFGFISSSQKEELLKRKKTATSGIPDDIKYYKDFYSHLKSSITNKNKGGFYKFIGYQEFVNRLFITDGIKLTDLETILIQKLRAHADAMRADSEQPTPVPTLEAIFAEYIADGRIRVNNAFLALFENSLLICDEIHNTYNMNMKNNRGVAIQYLIDSVSSLRFLSMSATAINNSPTEVVELLNYLISPRKITKREFFTGSGMLLPGALEKLGQLSTGLISFVQDTNIKYFPRKEFMGEPFIVPTDVDDLHAGDRIPYLNFIACPMSDYHQATYNRLVQHGSEITHQITREEMFASAMSRGGVDGQNPSTDSDIFDSYQETEQVAWGGDDDSPNRPTSLVDANPIVEEVYVARSKTRPVEEMDSDESTLDTEIFHAVPTDGYSIYDMVFPNPSSLEYGIFRSADVRNKIISAAPSWRSSIGIVMKKYSNTNMLITGEFLQRKNLTKYSTKYTEMLNIIEQSIASSESRANQSKKIMIYHDRVKMSGVLCIQEILHMNGYIDEISEPVAATICCICGRVMSEHTNGDAQQSHEFKPVRYLTVHSDIERVAIDQALIKYNLPSNANGHEYMILIGSQIIAESYEIKDVQTFIITCLPISIPTFIQINGRCVRSGSHVNLPLAQRFVRIYILVSYSGPTALDPISPELYRYIDKIKNYKIIQSIEREFNKRAIDGDINRAVNMSSDMLREYAPVAQPLTELNARPTLGNLYFEPSFTLPAGIDIKDLNMTTWTAYDYFTEETHRISYIIKRLFLMQPVWTYDDLFARVKSPPINLEVNPKLFNESNFIIALHNLTARNNVIVDVRAVSANSFIDWLFDYSERYIHKNGARFKIDQIDAYYILFPVVDVIVNPISLIHAEYTEHIRDRERALIKNTVEPKTDISRDIETYARVSKRTSGTRVSINKYLQTMQVGVQYNKTRDLFIARVFANAVVGATDAPSDAIVSNIACFLYDYNEKFQTSFIEESIEAAVRVAMGAQPPQLMPLYAAVCDLMRSFDVIIMMDELAKYKDTVKQYKNGLPTVPSTTPMGYVNSRIVRLFDPSLESGDISGTNKQWLEVSKVSMNRQLSYKDNEIIVGYFESSGDSMKFKIRRPSHVIKSSIVNNALKQDQTKSELEGRAIRVVVADTRLIERGIVCGHKNKGDILNIIAKLGISVSSLPDGIKVRDLCEILRDSLIASETKERSKTSRWRYIYSWWDTVEAKSII